MILHPAELIEHYTALGVWGDATLHDFLREHARASPHLLALTDPPNKAIWTDLPVQRLTWSQAAVAVERLAWAMHAAGLRRDDVLLVQLPNVVEFALLHLACAQLGVVISPLHVQQRQHEVMRCAAISGAKALVTLRRVGKSDQQAFVHSLHQERGLALPVLWLDDLLAAGAAADLAQVETELTQARLRAPVTANDIHTIC